MSVILDVLDLAIQHAKPDEIIIYLDRGNHYDRNTACEDFMFHQWKTIISYL